MLCGTRRGLASRLLLLALLMACAVPPAASAIRIAYVSNGFPAGSQNISALRIGSTGALTPISGSPFATGGTITEGLAITPDAKRVYVTTAGTGDVRGFNVGVTGALSAVPGAAFATGSTPLGVVPAPGGTHVFVWNHGNSVGSWQIGATGSLSQVPGSPFGVSAGHTNPFAGSVAPDGQHLYAPLENTVPGGGSPDALTVYSVAPDGALAIIQTIATGNNPFGSAITPSGKNVYVSNPEPDPGYPNGSISAYRVNANGTLTSLGAKYNVAPGNHPLGMAITPDGKYLYVATRVTNTVNAYRINPLTGGLSSIAGSPFATGGVNGKALALTPDGKRLYVSNNGSDNVSGFNVADTGSLTPIGGSPWPTGGTDPDLESIVITPNQAPKAAFTVTIAEAGKPTEFKAAGSSDSDGTVETYTWDFGDGNQQTQVSPTAMHVYGQAGTFNVTLKVTDNEGCSTARLFTGKATLCNGSALAALTQQITILAPAPETPQPQPPPTPVPTPPTLPAAPSELPQCLGKQATIVGTRGADRIEGTRGSDVIVALGGADTIRGLSGSDLICGGDGNDWLIGGTGADSLSGGAGNDRLQGDSGDDRLFGNAGKDRLFGNLGKDVLSGGSGRDRLSGGGGNDRLRGGTGLDKLIGGPGRNDLQQ